MSAGAAIEGYVAKRFDDLADRFKSDVAVDDPRLRAVCRAIGSLQGLRVLDLGCGKGRFGRQLAAHGAEVFGLEPSAAMLRDAIGLGRVRGTASRLPFATESFDAVVAIEVFEHLAADAPALEEIARVLRPGGLAAIVDKNALALDTRRPWLPAFAVQWIDERRGLWMYPAGGPFRERRFRPAAFRAALAHRIGPANVEFLQTDAESHRTLFRIAPWACNFALWTARKAGTEGVHG